MADNYNHYFKSVEGLTHIDVYRVLDLFQVTHPSIQHAIKKLLVAGGRGSKDTAKDVAEAIVSLQRWQQMQAEMLPKQPMSPLPPMPAFYQPEPSYAGIGASGDKP